MRRPSFLFYLSLFALASPYSPLSSSSPLLSLLLLPVLSLFISGFLRYFVVEKLPWLRVPVHPQSAVFVTGCSSGFGKEFALSLAEKKTTVFATVRSDSDGAALVSQAPVRSQPFIIPIVCDVTQQQQVVEAVKIVERTLSRDSLFLKAVVNNAGITGVGSVEEVPLEKGRQIVEVNLFGVARVTRALLPLLRRSHSDRHSPRIVVISSINGIQSLTHPLMGWYNASKHAVEALTDALRSELPFPVILLEPGFHRTKMITKFQSSLAESLSSSSPTNNGGGNGVGQLRKDHVGLEGIQKLMPLVEFLTKPDGSGVVESLHYALNSSFPPTRMIIGADAVIFALINILPDSVIDSLNKLLSLV